MILHIDGSLFFHLFVYGFVANFNMQEYMAVSVGKCDRRMGDIYIGRKVQYRGSVEHCTILPIDIFWITWFSLIH